MGYVARRLATLVDTYAATILALLTAVTLLSLLLKTLAAIFALGFNHGIVGLLFAWGGALTVSGYALVVLVESVGRIYARIEARRV